MFSPLFAAFITMHDFTKKKIKFHLARGKRVYCPCDNKVDNE